MSDEKRDKIRFLTGMGFKRWQKGRFDRLYINAEDLGLELERLGPGVTAATLCGEDIEPSEALKLREAKTYIDLTTGKAFSEDYRLQQLAQDKFNSVWRRA